MFKSSNSYQILKQLCNEHYRFSGMIKDNRLSLKNFCSQYINEKIENFFDNVLINLNNLLFVCKYDRNKAINLGNNPHDCDFIICQQNDEGNILELDLKIKGNFVYPISNRAYANEAEADLVFKDLFENQDITLINRIHTKNDEFDYGKKRIVTEEELYNLVNSLEKYKLKYNCNIDITNNYKYLLKKICNQRQKRFDNYDIINIIINCIIEKKPITEEILNIESTDNLSKDILDLVNTLNDKVIVNSNYASQEGLVAYSKLQSQVKTLKEAKKRLTEQVNDLNEKLENTQNELEETNEGYQKALVRISNIKKALED